MKCFNLQEGEELCRKSGIEEHLIKYLLGVHYCNKVSLYRLIRLCKFIGKMGGHSAFDYLHALFEPQGRKIEVLRYTNPRHDCFFPRAKTIKIPRGNQNHPALGRQRKGMRW